VGNPFPEEFDVFDQVLSELIDAGYTAEEALEYMVQEASPIYSRGGQQRRTQTPRQIGVKDAPHNIPKGGTTISDRDPQGKRLFTGDQDRGKGNKAARRAAALKKEEYVDEAQYARNNPEKYEREQEKKQSSRERRMNDPKTGINSKSFNDFYNKQMSKKKN
jgi:hypothetical protein